MKKNHLTIRGLILLFSILLFACQKKDELGVTRPGFKEETGTGGNPFKGPINPNNPTPTNPATKNSSLYVGGIGWSTNNCAPTSPYTLKGMNGGVEVTLTFLNAPSSGTFMIAGNPSGQTCTMLVNNAPNQPAGIVWHGKSGLVVVNNSNTNNSVSATFTDVVCVQETFSFPTVVVNGNLGCN